VLGFAVVVDVMVGVVVCVFEGVVAADGVLAVVAVVNGVPIDVVVVVTGVVVDGVYGSAVCSEI